MRLYFSTTEFQPLVDHWQHMFPGSPMPKNVCVDDEGKDDDTKSRRRKSNREDLLKLLASTEHDIISSSDIFEATHITLKSAMRKLKLDQGFIDSCAELGWTYVEARGRGQKAGFSRFH
jgi:hypothetical protein